MDWVNYTSAFRAATPEVVFPWPPLCCRRTGNFIPINEDGCRVGHMDYLFTKVCLFALCFLPFPFYCPSVPLPSSLSSLAFSFFPFLLPGPPSFVWANRMHRLSDSDWMSGPGWMGIREATGTLSVAGAGPCMRACHHLALSVS